MPFVLFLIGAATLAIVATTSHAKTSPHAPPPPRPPSPYPLDPQLDPRLRAQVDAALAREIDPARLEAFATSLSAYYPYAAWYLRKKAEGLRKMGYGAPAMPALPAPRGDGLDANLPDSLRFNVIELLTQGSDPTTIEAFAGQLANYPLASAALRLRAAFLRSMARSAPPPAASTPMSPALPGFDPNLPPEIAMQVATALMTENDAAKLRALGTSLMAHYPTAATMLLAKANAMTPVAVPPPMGTSTASPTPSPTAPPQIALPDGWMLPQVTPVAAPPSASTASPMMSARVYRVKQGDFPIKIAKHFGQPEAAWRDLVDANGHKPTLPDGNFKLLLPGEDLNIPRSWPSMPEEAHGAREVSPAVVARPNPTLVAMPNVPAGPFGMPLPGAPALDSGIPAQTAQAVLNAAATETDPAKLRDFASSIMGRYPIAAAVLLAKANGLSIGVPAAIPAVFRPANLPAPPAVSASPAAGGAYKVERGDSPSRIAKKVTGNDRRWPELVKANPGKSTTPDGNFKSLQPGEVLALPASWTSSTRTNGAPARAPA
jgi:nucleoid-associated protein YgaU